VQQSAFVIEFSGLLVSRGGHHAIRAEEPVVNALARRKGCVVYLCDERHDSVTIRAFWILNVLNPGRQSSNLRDCRLHPINPFDGSALMQRYANASPRTRFPQKKIVGQMLWPLILMSPMRLAIVAHACINDSKAGASIAGQDRQFWKAEMQAPKPVIAQIEFD